MLEISLQILKVVSLIATFWFGLLGVSGRFTDEHGNVTKKGKIARVAITVVFVAALLAMLFEVWINKIESERIARQTLRQTQLNESTLQEINRTLSQFDAIGLSFYITVPKGIPAIDAYASRLDRELRDLLTKDDFENRLRSHGLDVLMGDADGVAAVQIKSGRSSLLPNSDEALALAMLEQFYVVLHFHKDPPSIESERQGLARQLSDLSVSFRTTLTGTGKGYWPHSPSRHFLIYNLRTSEIWIQSAVLTAEPDGWGGSTGHMSSMADLEGSRLIIYLRPSDGPIDMRYWTETIALLSGLDRMKVTFGRGRSTQWKRREHDDFETYKDAQGRPFYVMDFP